MKKIILALAVLMTAVFAYDSYALTMEEQVLKKELGDGQCQYNDLDDACGFRIKDVSGSTDFTVIVTSCTITIQKPSGTADTSVSTDGILRVSAAAEDTVGEMVNLIDATTTYECEMGDVRYALSPLYLQDGTNLIASTTFWAIYLDSGCAGTAYTMPEPATRSTAANCVGLNPGTDKKIVLHAYTANVNGTASLKIYEEDEDHVETLKFCKGLTDDTDQTTTFALSGGSWGWNFDKNHRVVIVGDSNTAADSGDGITVWWTVW